MKKIPAIIIDLDGTLCNVDHRLHLIRCENPDWDKFNSECVNDTVNLWCKDLMDKHKSGCCVIILTGRSVKEYDNTVGWLVKNNINYQLLTMRPVNNYQRGSELKKAILNTNAHLKYYDVRFAVDDNEDICKMWESLGIKALRCNNEGVIL